MAEIRDDTIDNVVVDTTPQDNIVDNTELDRVNVGETQYIVKNLDLNSLEFAPSDGEFVYNQNKAIYSGIFTYTVEGQTTPKQASGEIVLNISSGNGISISEDLTDSNLVISLNAETISAIESISTLQTDISTLQSGKVDKVQGKGLSTNDYTTEEKNKLASITPQNYSLITETGSIITLEINSSTYEITASLKDKNGNVISTSQSIDLPLENVVVSGRYDATNQKIVLELENGNTIDVPVGALVSGLQSEITSTNKLDADLVDDTTSANKFVTAQEKTKIADALTSETDPTVPSWAKQPNKPTYDYSEITNTPSIPTVNNPTITITQGGVTKGSFTLNQATGDTIALDAGGQQNVVSDAQVDDVSVVSNSVAKIYTSNGDYNASTNKFVTENDIANFVESSDLKNYAYYVTADGYFVEGADGKLSEVGGSVTNIYNPLQGATQDFGTLARANALQPIYQAHNNLVDKVATKQDAINDLASIRSGASAGATAVQPADISDVVTHDDSSAVSESTLLDNYYTKTQIIDLIYPIGSVFITVNNVNPRTYLPNTNWELIEDRFLLGAGSTYTAGATGGEATHTLTIDEMPSHRHRLWSGQNSTSNAASLGYRYCYAVGGCDNDTGTKGWYDTVSANNTNHQVVEDTGSGQAHNNMPPYLAVYMWKRIPLANS